MKKNVFALMMIASSVFGYEVKYVADTKFCIQTGQPFQVCAYAQEFVNFIDLMKAGEKIDKKDKKALEKVKIKTKNTFRQLCSIWDTVPPLGREFIEKNVTNEGAPLINEGEMVELCLKIQE